MDTASQSFDERISRVPLWTLIPAVFGPGLAWTFLARGLGISATATAQLQNLLVLVGAFGWWLLKVAPRPYSVRASLGQPLDLNGWGVVALAFLGNVSVRVLWWILRDCRDLLQQASLRGGYTSRLPQTSLDAIPHQDFPMYGPPSPQLPAWRRWQGDARLGLGGSLPCAGVPSGRGAVATRCTRPGSARGRLYACNSRGAPRPHPGHQVLQHRASARAAVYAREPCAPAPPARSESRPAARPGLRQRARRSPRRPIPVVRGRFRRSPTAPKRS
jgi:hypothetical protein